MNVYIINHGFNYETEKIIRLFFPFEKLTFFSELGGDTDDNYVLTSLDDAGEETLIKAEIRLDSRVKKSELRISRGAAQYDKECEMKIAALLYECFGELTGYYPSWGILTGVRPAKLMRKTIIDTTEEEAKRYFRDVLLVDEDKIDLCSKVGLSEENIISLSSPNSFSLYVAIPFCPSRCSYCSFVSHSVEKSAKLVPQYVELLCNELADAGKRVKKLGLKLETVYFGGGTPTTLSAKQLERVMGAVSDNFDLSELREYTVEAGRPDTITTEKLIAIKNGGATRISINPQTMNDRVLEEIGRKHTAAQTIDAFRLARKCGFDNINMDLIAGLPLDTVESFEKTLDSIINLNPENVTIHTLAMKRSSRLTTGGSRELLKQGAAVAEMLDMGRSRLSENGILPYYMYRQSKTVGNLENVGYSKSGYEGLYNVYIMDETHSIIACGASGVTKLRDPDSNKIERIFNYKYPYEYITRFDEILKRKTQVNEFYEQL